MVKTIEPQPDSFSLILNSEPTKSNKDNRTTDFKNTLFYPIFLKGEYELALENICFSNLDKMDLGILEVMYRPPNQKMLIWEIAITAKLGLEYSQLFETLNSQVEQGFLKKEYENRLKIRQTQNVPEHINLIKNGDKEISLPLKDSNLYDNEVFREIKEMTPRLVYKDNYLSFKMNEEFSIRFGGNIKETIPELVNQSSSYTNNTLPIKLKKNNLPNFECCLVLCDIVQKQNIAESQLKILKFMSLSNTDKCAFHTFQLNESSYVPLEKDKQLVKPIKEISISLQTSLDQLLRFNQGIVSVRLHFRKIK